MNINKDKNIASKATIKKRWKKPKLVSGNTIGFLGFNLNIDPYSDEPS